MSLSRLPTVIIETENGPVIINESDYDPKIHRLHGVELPNKISFTFTSEKVKEFADENNLTDEDFAKLTPSGNGGKITKKDLEDYLDATLLYPFIGEDGKFTIVNRNGERVGTDSFENIEQANEAIKSLRG